MHWHGEENPSQGAGDHLRLTQQHVEISLMQNMNAFLPPNSLMHIPASPETHAHGPGMMRGNSSWQELQRREAELSYLEVDLICEEAGGQLLIYTGESQDRNCHLTEKIK